jgi:hypothetical protein
MKFEFSETNSILANVMTILDRLEGRSVRPDVQTGPGRRNDPDLAAIGRDLLWVKDMLSLAEAEVANAYWRHKGRIDPRFEQADRASSNTGPMARPRTGGDSLVPAGSRKG